jgi:deoxyribose-phosphate aldolase
MDMAKYIDSTLLKADATEKAIRALCDEAARYGFASVCVNPGWVPLCVDILKDTGVKVCTVIGFPLGATTTAAKVCEAVEAVSVGAREVDMVLNIGALKGGDTTRVRDDIAAVVRTVHPKALVKVILETCLLTREEIVTACKLARGAKADFVKTSTGFSTGGARVEDVALMRETVGPDMGVKASGGIRTAKDAAAMIAAGATRIGASSGAAIVEGK